MTKPARIETAREEKRLREALVNVRRALLEGHWSLAVGHTENALGIVGRKAA